MAARDANAQSPPPPRNESARMVNHLVQFQVVHNDYADADADNDPDDAAWGPPLYVLGYDFLAVGIAYTPGTATTGVSLRAQISDSKNPDAEWFDLYEDDGTGTLDLKTWTASLTAAGNAVFRFPVPGGAWVRFKTWVEGATPANSRITVSARPHMSAR